MAFVINFLRIKIVVEQILDQYKQANNQKKALIKQHIQYTFHQALEHRMIQDNCQIKFKRKKRKTQYIQIRNITPLLFHKNIFL